MLYRLLNTIEHIKYFIIVVTSLHLLFLSYPIVKLMIKLRYIAQKRI